MPTDRPQLTAVPTTLRDHERRTSHRVTPGPDAPLHGQVREALHAVPSAGTGGMVELLWNERRVDSYDLTHRISIPLAGHRLTRDAARRIGLTLAAWWVDAPSLLSNGTEITFVDAELRGEPLTPPELVVTLTTTAPCSDAQVANLRTIRDLRRAVREVRRGGAVAEQELSVVA